MKQATKLPYSEKFRFSESSVYGLFWDPYRPQRILHPRARIRIRV